MDSMADSTESKEIWGSDTAVPTNFTMHMDIKEHQIAVVSDDVDAKGRPVTQWELNSKNGHITETHRAKDGSEVQVTHKDVDPTTLDKAENSKIIAKEAEATEKWVASLDQPAKNVAASASEEQAAPVNEVIDEWNDLEKQRDIAFKIMYFFIVFILFTFSLLYAFFRMTQKEQEERMQKGGKGQR